MIPGLPYELVNNVPMTCFNGPKGSRLHLVHTMAEFLAFFEILMTKKRVSVDSETSGFDYYKEDRIVGLSFGWHVENFYLPVRHEDSVFGGKQPDQLDMDVIRPYLQKFFARRDVILIGHNLKFDFHFLKADGIINHAPFHDTRLLWQFVDENAPGALKTIASGWRDFMGIWHKGLVDKSANEDEKAISEWRIAETRARRKVYSEAIKAQAAIRGSQLQFQGWKKPVIKKWVADNDLKDHPYKSVGKEDIHYGFVPVLDMVKYAALDTFLAWCVYEHCLPLVQADKAMSKVYLMELDVAKALFDSEEHGLPVDMQYLLKLKTEFEAEIEVKEAEIRLIVGDINLKSTQQLAIALVAHGCILTEMSEKKPGNYCLDKKILAKLATKYPICQKILDLRKIEKLKNTYVDAAIAGTTKSGIIHPGYNQCVSTGRMSSSGVMNFQNLGRDGVIKKAFLAPEDYDYWFFDYSQVEVRLNAHLSQDPVLLESYNQGIDVHLRTSCSMFDIPYDEGFNIYADEDHPRYSELKEYRNVGKVLNFSIVYQVSAGGLSMQIPRPKKYKKQSQEEWVKTCEGFMEKYFQTHRAIKKYIIRGNRHVRAHGQIANTFGRVRHLPHVNAVKIGKRQDLKFLEAKAQRQGVNFTVQGEAGDVFKTACVRIHKLFKGKKSVMVGYCHDEVSLYIHKTERYLIPLVKKAMEDFNYDVPLVADASYSPRSWGEKKGVPNDVVLDVEKIEEYVKNVQKKYLEKAA